VPTIALAKFVCFHSILFNQRKFEFVIYKVLRRTCKLTFLNCLFCYRESLERLKNLPNASWRIDKSNTFSTAGILYTNISRLMENEPHWYVNFT